ncbi:uncharacterized protein LOC106512864, partial [Austrofundulus limnaeus]|uniref:Uncharacterized protein LOC106512864 n=1 Tax=Austrofundulus limnaeus TaxID=52670 RepID=A0A2I4AMZ7_AUSLI
MLSATMAEEENIDLDQGGQNNIVGEEENPQWESEKRQVKLTAKALLVKINKLESERKTKLNKLTKLRQTITVLKNDNVCVNDIKGEFKRFLVLSEETQKVHQVLLGLLPVDEAQKHDAWFQAKMLNVHDFVAVTHKWLTEAQGWSTGVSDMKENESKNNKEAEPNAASGGGMMEEELQNEPHDSISYVSVRSSRKTGSQRGSSVTTSRSSTLSEQIKAEAERAALLACAAALKEKHALEKQEYLLKTRKEQLEMDTKIAAANAKLMVLEGSTKGSITSKHSDEMDSYIRKGARPKIRPTLLLPQASQLVIKPAKKLQQDAGP